MVARPALEVGDIFRDNAPRYKRTEKGHLSLEQLKVISAITRCRSAQLGGHQLHCSHCETDTIAYNSCRNRHCPKCQSSAAKRWLEARQSQLLSVDYYHVVFTLPAEVAQLAFYNKADVYGLLFSAASQTLMTIARDKKHLGADIGATMVLHTWGSSMTHHPHVHCIVPGGGISHDKGHWQSCKKGFFLPVKVLSRLFRRLFVEGLRRLYDEGRLQCFGKIAELVTPALFDKWCYVQQTREWVVYAKKPFAGPEAVLAYLSRYTHRVAIANSRLTKVDEQHVSFTYKDYRLKGRAKRKTMQLGTMEFMRRFMLHVLPSRFHRIRHFGLLASRTKLALARRLLVMPKLEESLTLPSDDDVPFKCHACQNTMTVSAITEPLYLSRAPPRKEC
jgi:hypothetical protein